MNIAIFASFSGSGGVERLLTLLVDGLIELGHNVDLLLVKNRGAYMDKLPSKLRTIKLGPEQTFLCVPALARYLRRQKPDILVAAKKRGNAAAVLAKKLSGTSVPLVLRIDTNLSAFLEQLSPVSRWYHRRLAQCSYPSADSVVAVSRGVADDLASLVSVPEDRLRVIYNPVVSHELFLMAEEEPDHPWVGDNAGPPVILGAGRLTDQKDFATLLKAFALLRKQRPARLIIAGEGPLRPRLEKFARELGVDADVSFPGFVPNIYSLMTRSRVFVLSSAWEGFGNVLAEAMAVGTPVVSTDCPSGPREILEDGAHGRLVPVSNYEAMAGAILDTLDNPPDPSGLRTAAERFSVGASAQEHMKLFQVLVGQPT